MRHPHGLRAASSGGSGLLEDMNADFVIGGGYSTLGPVFSDVSLNESGTKLYGVTSSSGVYTLREYTLLKPWDISYAKETATKVLIGQHTGPPYFTSDGLSMYITWRVDSVLPKIYQYSLSTAWDITTLTKVGEVIPSQATDGTLFNSVTFKPDGSVVYFGGGNCYIYSAPLSTPWNITTMGAVTTLNATTQLIQICSIKFSSDGTKLYIGGQRAGNIGAGLVTYTLSTAWNLSTATFTSASTLVIVTTPLTNPSVLTFSSDGSKVIFKGSMFSPQVNNTWLQGTLAAPWNAGTFQLTPNSRMPTSLGSSTSNYFDFDFSSDGLNFFVYNRVGTSCFVQSYNLSTPWDLSTRGTIVGQNTVVSKTSAAGLLLTPDKTKYLVTVDAGIYEYTMSTPGVSSPATNTASYTTATGYTYSGSLCWNNNGTKLFVVSNNGTASTRRVLQFDLATPYSISGMTFAGIPLSLPSTPDLGSTFGLGFAKNGTVFYLGTTYYLFKYNLTTAWDLTTATFAATYKVDWWDYTKLSFRIVDTIKKVFFLSNGTNVNSAGYPVNPKGALYSFTL